MDISGSKSVLSRLIGETASPYLYSTLLHFTLLLSDRYGVEEVHAICMDIKLVYGLFVPGEYVPWPFRPPARSCQFHVLDVVMSLEY